MTTTTTTTSTSSYKESIKTTTIKNHSFDLPPRYTPIKVMGSGAYGVVISAKDEDVGNKVAIKKVNDWSGDWVDGLRILREVKLLRHFSVHQHKHLVGLNNLLASPIKKPFDEVYVIMDFMDTDMHKIIYSKNKLSEQHLQVWIQTTLKALRFLHTGKIIHRDLKPSNLLLNKDCSLKVCDFGLARGIGQEIDKEMTEYVVTRWYRAPELMCGCNYGEKIDVWALGCIFAELIIRKPFFPGKDYKNQLELIFNVMGTPSQEDVAAISNMAARKHISKMKQKSPQALDKFNSRFAQASRLEIDLLKKMLTFNPDKRISVEEALEHPWIRHLSHGDEDICPTPLSFAFEDKKVLPMNDRAKLREAMWGLVREINPELPQSRQMSKKALTQRSK